MLKQQEILALSLIFRGDDLLCKEMRERIHGATSTNWEETGVGFYSTIKLPQPLSEMPELCIQDYSFKHPDFMHGGLFICTIVEKDLLELEAVTLGGQDWPYPENIEDFSDLNP